MRSKVADTEAILGFRMTKTASAITVTAIVTGHGTVLRIVPDKSVKMFNQDNAENARLKVKGTVEIQDLHMRKTVSEITVIVIVMDRGTVQHHEQNEFAMILLSQVNAGNVKLKGENIVEILDFLTMKIALGITVIAIAMVRGTAQHLEQNEFVTHSQDNVGNVK